MEKLKSFGAFFGVAERHGEIKKWQNTVEDRIKNSGSGLFVRVTKSSKAMRGQRVIERADELIANVKVADEADSEDDDTDDEVFLNAQEEVSVDDVEAKFEDVSEDHPVSDQTVGERKKQTQIFSNTIYESFNELADSSSATELTETLSHRDGQVFDATTSGPLKPSLKEKQSSDKSPTKQKSVKFSVDVEDKKTPDKDLLKGADGYAYYRTYVKVENEAKIEEMKRKKENKVKEYDWKIDTLNAIVKQAQAYYLDPESAEADEWKELKKTIHKSSSHKINRTEVRRKLSSIPEFTPYLTFLLIIAEVAVFTVLCALGGFTSLGVEPKLGFISGVKTFLGTETVHKWILPNIWIGPDRRFLIRSGALYSPCMRDDMGIRLNFKNFSLIQSLGCCEVAARATAGTTSEDECSDLTAGVGQWREDVPCASRTGNASSVPHILKPCCTDLKGSCQLLTDQHCIFLGGVFHRYGPEHCSQVNCIPDICGSISGFDEIKSQSDTPWLSEKPTQWWRVAISLFYHQGVIHLVLVIGGQLLLMRPVEETAGWFRVLLIHLIAGTAGLMTEAILEPYYPHVGATAAVSGFLGVILVELLQFWKVVVKPWLELLKLIAVLVVLLFAGTFPYVNNFSIMMGIVVGALTGIIVLPYITFGHWHTGCRIILIVFAIPMLILTCFFIAFLFYDVQIVTSCKTCKLLNCVPYTERMCIDVY